LKDEKKKDNRETRQRKTRIAWARSLSNTEVCSILQNKLLEVRSTSPRKHEVSMIEELVHEIKHRISEYTKLSGELPKKEVEDDEESEN